MGGLLAIGLCTGCGQGDRPAGVQAPAAAVRPAPAASAAPVSPASAAVARVPAPASATQPAEGLPQDVVEFRRQRDACDHFRGETAYDSGRAAFLAAQLKLHCTGTDRALAELRRRHVGNPQALAALKDYEDDIE